MRAGCVIAFVCCLPSLAAAAEQEFPYSAYVARREAAVRSGPGRNYYATDKLSAGETVEVYRHQDDWCAIRPPPDSFSWVNADDLRIGNDGTGVVLTQGATSRIGSRTSQLCDVIQVRLERGEQVEVLDAVQVSNDNGVEFYCKIAPPSGEFRWIHKDDISRERLGTDGDQDGDATLPTRRPSRQPRSDRQDEESNRSSDRWGSWVRSRRADRGDEPAVLFAEGARQTPPTNRSRSIAFASSGEAAAARHGAESDLSSLESDHSGLAEVERLDRELSRIVIEEPAQWNFDAVRRRVDEAAERATSAVAHRKLRDLQERIARFEDIHRRSLALEHVAASSPGDASASLGEPGSRDTTETDPARYDGVGKLTRVVSQRPGAPRYALVNRENEVVSFVSPAPGVDLQTFEGEYVGISGQRGYMPELKKPHVTAMRVNPLDSAPSRLARRQSYGVR